MRALPDELTIKESEKDGLGLFARYDIVFFPHSICNIHHPYLGWLRTAVGAFLNHSDTPNCIVYESTSEIKATQSIMDLELYRYLLGTDSNFSPEGIPLKIRYLVQKGRINAGDEITIPCGDLKHHGIRSSRDPSFPEEVGETQRQTEKDYSNTIQVHSDRRQLDRVGQD